jgi:hypothetical protein
MPLSFSPSLKSNKGKMQEVVRYDNEKVREEYNLYLCPVTFQDIFYC